MIYPFPVVTGKLHNHSLDEPSRMSKTSVQSLTKPLILQAGFSSKHPAREPSQTTVECSSIQPGGSVSHGFIGTSLSKRCASHFSIYLHGSTRCFRNPSRGEWGSSLCRTAGCSPGWFEQDRGQKICLWQFGEGFLRANAPLHGRRHQDTQVKLKIQETKGWLFKSPGLLICPRASPTAVCNPVCSGDESLGRSLCGEAAECQDQPWGRRGHHQRQVAVRDIRPLEPGFFPLEENNRGQSPTGALRQQQSKASAAPGLRITHPHAKL